MQIRNNFEIKNLTTYKIGGKVKTLYLPETLEEHSMRLTIIIILVTVIYGFIWWKTKKQRKSGQNENNQ